jgi:hypothetical protein
MGAAARAATGPFGWDAVVDEYERFLTGAR